MKGLFNSALFNVVRKIYDELVFELSGSQNINSEEFLSSFSYHFIPESSEYYGWIVDAGFHPDFRAETEKAVKAFYSHSAGLDSEGYLVEAVGDFLNYIIPRTIGVPTATEIFERYYRQFDLSIFGPSALVTGLSLLRDVFDHTGGSMHLPPGFRLAWFTRGFPGEITHPYLRERTIPFFEIRSGARPLWRGRDLSKETGHFVLQYSFRCPKNAGLLNEAYRRAYESTTQFLLATRLMTFSTAYSDYRGLRTVGHLSAHNMALLNYPDELIEDGESRNLEEPYSDRISRLLEKLLSVQPEKFALIQQKIEDALRRSRKGLRNNARAQKMNEIDQLLDFFQILEAVVPFEGSHNISLAAARLLTRPGDLAAKPLELYQFIKDMHTIRNDVMHGRVDQVLEGKKGAKLDIDRFRAIIYSLACLHIMNGPLRDFSIRLALGEPVKLEREYFDDYAAWNDRKKIYALQSKNLVFW